MVRIFLALVLGAFSTTAVEAQDRHLLTELWRIEGGGTGAGGVWFADAAYDATTGHLWLLDDATDTLRLWDTVDGLRQPPTPNPSASIGFRGPVHLSWAPDGRLAVLDVLEHAVFKISPTATIVEKAGLTGPKLRFPKDFLISADGYLVILGATGAQASGVRIYAPSGTLLAQGINAVSTGEPRVDPMVAGGVGELVDGRLFFSRAQSPELLEVGIPDLAIFGRSDPPEAFPTTGREFMKRTDTPNGPNFTFDWFFTRPTGLVSLDRNLLLHVTTDFQRGSSKWSVGKVHEQGIAWLTWTVDRPLQPLLVSEGIVLTMERHPGTGHQSLVAFRIDMEGMR